MIHIVTALQCEAKPLIRRFELNGRQAENGFRIYENPQMRVIVAGVGKMAAAAATAYLQGQTPHQQAAWLNLGVGGHATLEIGELILANKIIDSSSQTRWYPPLSFPCKLNRQTVTTVDSPETDYGQASVYEMEASGFYSTACRFSSTEMVQACKIISDNLNHSIEKVSPQHVESIITAQMAEIETFIHAQLELHQTWQQQSPPEIMADFMAQWRFTVAQQHQLQRLLQKWQARTQNEASSEIVSGLRTSKEVIKALQQRIESAPLNFGTAQ